LLESSLGVRAHAEEAAHELEAATAQLNVLKQQASELQAKMMSLRVEREASMKQADTLRDSLAGVRARTRRLRRF